MEKNNLVAPVLKCPGGKRKLLDTLVPLLPDMDKITTYCEPFVGGGALFFHLQPQNAIINDRNTEFTKVYQVIKNDVESLIEELKAFENTEECFYSIRNLDRVPELYDLLSDTQKAARTLYLNKTCFNGLYRVNSSGQFNAPFGKYPNPTIINEDNLQAVSEYLNSANIKITSGDYSDVLKTLPTEDSFVFLDPPYDSEDAAIFTGYTKERFSRYDQLQLRKWCDAMNDYGIKFMLTNAATSFVLEQYTPYNLTFVKSKRVISSDANKRREADEVIIRNYG